MAIADSAGPRFEMGRVLRRTFSVISDNALTFALLSLPPAVSMAVLSARGGAFADDEGAFALPDLNILALFVLGGLFYLVTAVVLQGAVVHGAIATLNGKRASFADCLATGLRYLVPLLFIGLLATLGMIVGFILLIVPGIIVSIVWCVVYPVCVVERSGVSGAFGRSQELTRGYRWQIFGFYVAFIVFIIMVSIVSGALVALDLVVATDIFAIAAIATDLIETIITLVIGSTFSASVYYELRQLKEGIGPEALASVFD